MRSYEHEEEEVSGKIGERKEIVNPPPEIHGHGPPALPTSKTTEMLSTTKTPDSRVVEATSSPGVISIGRARTESIESRKSAAVSSPSDYISQSSHSQQQGRSIAREDSSQPISNKIVLTGHISDREGPDANFESHEGTPSARSNIGDLMTSNRSGNGMRVQRSQRAEKVAARSNIEGSRRSRSCSEDSDTPLSRIITTKRDKRRRTPSEVSHQKDSLRSKRPKTERGKSATRARGESSALPVDAKKSPSQACGRQQRKVAQKQKKARKSAAAARSMSPPQDDPLHGKSSRTRNRRKDMNEKVPSYSERASKGSSVVSRTPQKKTAAKRTQKSGNRRRKSVAKKSARQATGKRNARQENNSETHTDGKTQEIELKLRTAIMNELFSEKAPVAPSIAFSPEEIKCATDTIKILTSYNKQVEHTGSELQRKHMTKAHSYVFLKERFHRNALPAIEHCVDMMSRSDLDFDRSLVDFTISLSDGRFKWSGKHLVCSIMIYMGFVLL